MTRRQTRRLQQLLLTAYNKAADLELALLQEGKTEEARKARRKVNALRRKIDELRAIAWSDWTGRAATLEAELRTNNRKLQASIRRIESTVETAAEVVEALKYVDEAIATAARIAAKL